ncbi:MAG: hypothetical protein DCC71_19375 [Proteobacteria bacterium]|nr:MAG: hypothetical protein DCC71_19375 [Pseudomonadota bacterium]
MRLRPGIRLVLATCALACASSPPVRAAEWIFTTIAAPDETLVRVFPGSVSMNESGEVAFIADVRLPGGEIGRAVYRGTGGALTTVLAPQSVATPEQWVGETTSINAFGQVAFLLGDWSTGRIHVDEEPPLDPPVADSTGPIEGLVHPVLDDAGRVAFWARYDGTIEQGLFTIRNGEVVKVSGGPSFRKVYWPRINGAGRLSFVYVDVHTDGEVAARVAIDGGPVEIMASAGPLATPTYCDLVATDIDSAGRVAFSAGVPNACMPRIVAASDGAAPYDVLGPTAYPLSLRLDDAGRAVVATIENQLVTVMNGVSEPVIGAGDALLGSTVTALALGDAAASGRIAFSATLADGRQLAVRADPVPEPAAAALGAVALAALAAGARGGRRPACD